LKPSVQQVPKKNFDMNDQQKLYRVFRLIQLLSQRPYRKVARLAEILEISPETGYRYIRLLQAIGYQIDHDEHYRYFLLVDFTHEDGKLLDTEEAGFLQDLLWQAPAGHPLRDRLLHKLNRQYTLAPLMQSLVKFNVYEHIRTLGQALESERRVRLHNYYTGEGKVGTRYVEPVEFQQGYTYIFAFDLDRKDYRQFKIERISDVEILDEPITGEHESRTLDIFGWTGPRWLTVTLKLSTRAHQLLLEEYPDARPFVRTHKGRAIFDGMVRDWHGIGRFILGLPGQVAVVEPEELKQYLRKRIGEFDF